MSVWRHLRAVALLPAMVTLVVPAALLLVTSSAQPAWRRSPLVGALAFVAGGGLIVVGLALFGWTVLMFQRIGRGTLAPWDETRRLVVEGVYRHVRNPMISGVACVLLGEAIVLGSLPVLGWAVAFALVNAVYILLVEEAGLEQRFGEEYVEYRRNVPRWLPRLTPWRPG